MKKLVLMIGMMLVLAKIAIAGWVPIGGVVGCDPPNQAYQNTLTQEIACCGPTIECPMGGPEGRLFTAIISKDKEGEEVFRLIFLNPRYKGRLFYEN